MKRRGFDAEVFESGDAVSRRICEIIEGRTVGFGSSMTIARLGLHDKIKERAAQVFFHLPGGAGEDERNALTADFYLTSANAISMDGHIVNIDGTGNRVAATCFGPRRVVYVIGRNKITETLEQARQHAKDTAVKLAKHFKRKTPCVKTGRCENCLSPQCVCSITAIHCKKPYGVDISVFLIDEDYGL